MAKDRLCWSGRISRLRRNYLLEGGLPPRIILPPLEFPLCLTKEFPASALLLSGQFVSPSSRAGSDCVPGDSLCCRRILESELQSGHVREVKPGREHL